MAVQKHKKKIVRKSKNRGTLRKFWGQYLKNKSAKKAEKQFYNILSFIYLEVLILES